MLGRNISALHQNVRGFFVFCLNSVHFDFYEKCVSLPHCNLCKNVCVRAMYLCPDLPFREGGNAFCVEENASGIG